jgi:tape measure domain-containing protein
MNMDTAIKFTAKFEGTGLDQLKRGLQGLEQQSKVTKAALGQANIDIARMARAAGNTTAGLRTHIAALKSLRDNVDINSQAYRRLGKQIDELEAKQRKLTAAVSPRSGVTGLLAMGGGLGGLAAAAGGTLAVKYVADVGMQAESAEVRLKALTNQFGEYNQAQAATERIAKTLRISNTEAQESFASLYASLRPTGITLKELEDAFIGFSAAARNSGSTAQETSNALIQLKQGLASGVLQGEELRSIREQAPLAAQAIAKELGVTIGELKDLASEGKVTTDVVLRALAKLKDSQLGKLNQQFNTGAQAVKDLQIATEKLGIAIAKTFGPTAVRLIQAFTRVLERAADLGSGGSGAQSQLLAQLQAQGEARRKFGALGAFTNRSEYNAFIQQRTAAIVESNRQAAAAARDKAEALTPEQKQIQDEARREREAAEARGKADALKDELKIRKDTEDKLADAAQDHARELADFRKQTAKQVADYERDLGDQRLTLERSIGEARRRVAATEKDMALESEKQRRAALGLSTEAIDFQKQLNDETRRFTEENIKIEQQASDRNRDLARKLEEFKLQVSDTAGKIQEGYARKVSDILQDAGRKLAAQMEKGATNAAATLSSAGGGTATPGSVPAGSLGTSKLVQLAKSAGFGANDAAIMAAIAMAESGGRSGAHNNNASTGDNSYGLWQINMLGGMGPQRRRQFGIAENDALFDPATNANAARAVFGSQGFGAWSVYRSGAYKQYLPEAQAAAAAGVAGGQAYRVGDIIPQSATGAAAAGPAPGSFAGDAARLIGGLTGSVDKTKELSETEKRAQQEANINQLISSRQSALTQVTSQLDGQTKSIGDQLRDQLRINELVRSGINPEVAKSRVEAENGARAEQNKLEVLRDQLTLDLQGNALTEEQRIKVEKILADTIQRQQAQKGIVDGIVAENEKLVRLNETMERQKQLAAGIAGSIGQGLGSAMDLLINGTENWGNSLRQIGATVLKDIARQITQIMIIQPIVKGLTSALSPGGGIAKLFGFADGGIMTGAGPVPLRKYASGGIANSPQMALYGEGSMPEAFVPLPDGRRIPVAMKGGSGGGSTNVTVNVDASGGTQVQGNPGQAEQLGRAVSQAVQAELIRQKRPGGLLAA